MQEDWKASIVKIIHWKQIANLHDRLDAFPWHFPNVAANGTQITEAEASMGTSFSVPYREFLGLANGWDGFIVSTDLFGTEEFVGGRALEIRNRSDVQDYLSSLDIPEEMVIPIGVSETDTDVFLLISEKSPTEAGRVIWLAGIEVERYPDFRAFFESMVNYNARLAQKLADQK